METTLPKPPSADQPESVPTETKPKKEKKPATPAQQAAREKGLKAMMEKRKQIAEVAKEKKEKIKVAKKVIEDKIIKEDLGFVTKQDFDSMRKELMELRALTEAHRIVKETPPPKAERIVERIIEKAPTQVAPPTRLTGHALLDKLFFEK